MTKSLVLDVDGVLVRDPLLLEHVRYNAVQYVRAKLPDAKQPDRVNRILYKQYGHTAIGLEKAFRINASDFNSFVYNKKLTTHLWEYLTSTEYQQDARVISEILDNGWDVTLFSNSPLEWTVPVLQATDRRLKIHTTGFLKPDVRAYTGLSARTRHLFVDDKRDNLRPVVGFRNWTPVHFREGIMKDNETRPEFPTVSSVWELGLICGTINDWGFGTVSNL
jgi:phosphoserine phosphatase